jgi:hypothetical protein
MKAIILALALAAAPVAALAASPPEIVGDWKGALQGDFGALPMVFHVSAEKAVADSPDQSVFGMPAMASANGGSFKIDVPMVGGYFEGRLGADGKSLGGIFYQNGASLSLDLTRTSTTPTMPAPAKPTPAEIRGDWQTSMGPATILYHLTEAPTAELVGRGADGIPVDVEKVGDQWRLTILKGLVFAGTLAADGKSMTGTLSQAGQGANVTLTRK